MMASTRRIRRTRRTLAAAAALTLGLAACGGDDTTENDDTEEVEAPAEDTEVEDEPVEEDATDGADEQAAPPAFEDLEDGELVPGVYLDIPDADQLQVQAQPTPVGSGYIAAFPDQSGAVSLNVEFDGPPLDELLGGVDELVDSGQAEVASGPEEVEVEGADEASRIELAAPEGGATAIGIFAVADGNAISLAIEVTEGAEVDVEAMIESLRIDPERLQMAGTAELPEAPVEDGAADAGTEGTAPEDGEADAAETDEPDETDETEDEG